MACRTKALGGHKQSCPDDHFHRIWYNSCKHRMCPQCDFLQIQQWLEKQKARILSCDHFHVIFTIPSELRFLWHFNVKFMTQLLFTSARDTLFELLGDATYMGGTPGLIASLHTWTKTMLLHPHIHCLVTGGGLSKDGQWKTAKKDFLLPYGVIRNVFRRNVRRGLLKALEKGNLKLPEGRQPQQVINLLNKLGRKKWNVKICEKYSHGNGVLTYLARYLRGGPISNKRIIHADKSGVMINYGRKKREVMTLPVREFVKRLLQHTPLPHSIHVRSYGLYASARADALNTSRKLLGQGPVMAAKKIHWQDCFSQSTSHPEQCPVCGKRLIVSAYFKPVLNINRSGAPPPPLIFHNNAA